MLHRPFPRAVFLAAIALALGGSAFDQDSKPAAPAAKIGDLAHFAGTWRAAMGRAEVEEFWTPPKAGAMFGISRTTSGDRTREFEYLRIVEKGGTLVYVAQPGGKAPTEFKLSKLTADEAVFENPEHDFPNKIAYVKKPDGELHATIYGPGPGPGGKERSMTFEYAPAK